MHLKKITFQFEEVLFESKHHIELETRTLSYEVETGLLNGDEGTAVRLDKGLSPDQVWEVIKKDYPFI